MMEAQRKGGFPFMPFLFVLILVAVQLSIVQPADFATPLAVVKRQVLQKRNLPQTRFRNIAQWPLC